MTIPVHGGKAYARLAAREGELWGEAKLGVRLSWLDSPSIYQNVNRWISGHPHTDWLDHLKQRHCRKPAPRGLNLGCGHGELERLILARGLAERMDGFDISAGAVETARKRAEEGGLAGRTRYFAADANFLERCGELDPPYDIVFASMALHHFAHLERCLDSVRELLAPGGLFVVNEFIGPDRFQWTDAQLDAVNRMLRCFPRELRANLRQPGEYKDFVERPSRRHMEKHFAFEAICSERIVPALRGRFETAEEKYYGGTVLHLLFEAIMGNFKEEERREHAVMVRMAIEWERHLLDNGALGHDHGLFVCRNRR